jgi:hypothetical protein
MRHACEAARTLRTSHGRAAVRVSADPDLHRDRGRHCDGLVVVPFIIAPSKPDPEKLSAYECGFNAFDDARMKFDVRFYLVSILFIIFDLEVAFLFPWAITLMKLRPASSPSGR